MVRVLRVVALVAVVGVAGGCAKRGEPRGPSATVQRVAPTYADTDPEREIVPDTTIATVSTLAVAPIPTAPMVDGTRNFNLIGVAEAALAADAAREAQFYLPKNERDNRLFWI